MGKHYKSKETFEVFTFEEMVAYARENTVAPHWAFRFYGIPFTQENENMYIVVIDNKFHHFHRSEVLLINNDEIKIITKEKLREKFTEL